MHLHALQGCLAAFFAKEEVTWACPAEVKAASAARSGSNQGQELASCSPSVDVSTPGARENFKRRRCGARAEAMVPGMRPYECPTATGEW